MKHINHEWYVTKLVHAARVRDWTLRDCLRRDVAKMPLEQRRAILDEVHTTYGKAK